ncbi:MAG: Hpt domain-containing protein [Gemmataceae bacterium]
MSFANLSSPLAFDRRALLAVADGDIALMRDLARLFLVDGPQTLGRLRLGLAGGHGVRVQMAAHTLAGSVALFGDDRSVELARRLESLGRRNDLAGAEPVAVELTAAVDALCHSLAQFLEDTAECPSS